ncbi:MAG TPA: branched-chain amino acid ABC transporter permease [Candidatus Limnocylindrales bacterium]|jgi:branched-subunit amino acid ABC-type transport system permease component
MIWIQALIQGLLLGGLYALSACGLSLLYGVMGAINLAHGDLAIIAAYLAIVVIPIFHLPGLLAFLIVVPAFLVFGYLGQRTLIQATLDRGPLTTLLVSFGVSIVLQNLLLQLFSADSHSIDIGSFVAASIQVNDEISIAYLSLGIFVVAVVVLLALQLFLSRTTTGRLIRAVADDREAAQLSGTRYRHVFGIAAALAIGTVALAGLAFGMVSSFGPTSGSTRLLFAFEAVVIGGLGSLWGTLAGGIVLGVAQAIGAAIDPSLGVLAGHVVFLVVLAVRPNGIAGARVTA